MRGNFDMCSKEHQATLERLRVEQQRIMNDKLVAQEETHAAAIKSAVSIAVQTATSALRDKYGRRISKALLLGMSCAQSRCLGCRLGAKNCKFSTRH